MEEMSKFISKEGDRGLKEYREFKLVDDVKD
jgi:hypothetical protein